MALLASHTHILTVYSYNLLLQHLWQIRLNILQ